MDANQTLDYNPEPEANFMPIALRWGLITAGVSVAYSLVGSLTGLAMSMPIINTIFGLAVPVVMAYLTINAYKTELGGFISFGQGFKVSFVAMLISSVVSAIFSFVYLNFIDPSAIDQIMEMTQSMLEGMGMSEDVIEQSLEEQVASLQSPMSMVTSFFSLAVISAIIAAIVAAIMKNERPAAY